MLARPRVVYFLFAFFGAAFFAFFAFLAMTSSSSGGITAGMKVLLSPESKVNGARDTETISRSALGVSGGDALRSKTETAAMREHGPPLPLAPHLRTAPPLREHPPIG